MFSTIFILTNCPWCGDLIESLLSTKPCERLTAEEILIHPFFWSAEKRMNFFCKASDYLMETAGDESDIWKSIAASKSYNPYQSELEAVIQSAITGRTAYDDDDCTSLLRMIRNFYTHFGDLSDELQEFFGWTALGVGSYFAHKFPALHAKNLYDLQLKLSCI